MRLGVFLFYYTTPQPLSENFPYAKLYIDVYMHMY